MKSYREGEYDFGIDKLVIMSLVGCSPEEADLAIAAHSKNGATT